MPDRMSTVARRRIRRMSPAIHKNGPEAVRSAGFEDVEPFVFAIVYQLRTVSRRYFASSGGRFAAYIRFIPNLNAIGKHRPCPRLKRHLAQLWFRGKERVGRFSRVGGEESEIGCH